MRDLFSLTPTKTYNTDFISFKNYGVLSHKFTDAELAPVWEEINLVACLTELMVSLEFK